MIEIDGSQGEGGGQMLRSSLSLAICTQQPFRIVNIRANRDKPGLMRQHLTAVKAAAEISDAEIEGAEIGSRELTFKPRTVKSGHYSFAIGSAGSATLVLQTVLLPLLMAAESSKVRIVGGTHNRGSPPFDFLQRAFLPLVARMGGHVDLQLRSYGFFPRGGGEIVASIVPPTSWSVLDLIERGAGVRTYAEAYVAALSIRIAQRELEVIGQSLSLPREQLFLRGLSNEMGPGNAVTITVEHEHVTEVFTGFGERGVTAETVASGAAAEALQYLSSTAAVSEHLADQLLLPMVLARGGSFKTHRITEHLRSNAAIVETFTSRRVRIAEAGGCFLVRVI